jgi:hypothetical protein
MRRTSEITNANKEVVYSKVNFYYALSAESVPSISKIRIFFS